MSWGISHLQGGVLHHHQGENGRPEVPQQLVPRCVAGVCWRPCGRPAWAPREPLATPPFPFIRHSKEFSSCCDAREPPSRQEDLCISLRSLNPCYLQNAVLWEGHRPAWRGLCPGGSHRSGMEGSRARRSLLVQDVWPSPEVPAPGSELHQRERLPGVSKRAPSVLGLDGLDGARPVRKLSLSARRSGG